MEITKIHPDPIIIREYWIQFLKYKSLVWIFAWQEIKTQYAQTYFGVFWAVLRPVIILSIFTVLFSYLLKIHTASPYILFAFTGMIAWNLFSQIAATASSAISLRQDLIRKMYFPKIILPLSKALVAGVDTFVSLIMFFVLAALVRFPLSWHIFLFPFFFIPQYLSRPIDRHLDVCAYYPLSRSAANCHAHHQYRDLVYAGILSYYYHTGAVSLSTVLQSYGRYHSRL